MNIEQGNRGTIGSPELNGVAGIDQLPQGFFENNMRLTQSKKIFESDTNTAQNDGYSNSIRGGHEGDSPQDMRNEIRHLVNSQLKSYLDSMRVDILSEFNYMLQQDRESAKLNQKEVHDLRTEINEHQGKFENLKYNIHDIDKRISDVNDRFAEEADGSKRSAPKGDSSQAGGVNPNELGIVKQEILKEVRGQLKKEGIKVLPQMQEFKTQFDGQLRAYFERLNDRVKSVEETIHDIRKNKFKTLDNMKKELSMNMTNTQEALVEDNSSLKAQLEHFVKEHQAQYNQQNHANGRSPNSPAGNKSMETPSVNKMSIIERKLEDNGKNVAAVSAKVSEQFNSLERSTISRVTGIQHEMQSLRDVAESYKSQVQKQKHVSAEEVQNFSNSVDYLKSITLSCQDQIASLQNQINSLRSEKYHSIANDNFLKQLETRVDDLKKTLANITQKQQAQTSTAISSTNTPATYTSYNDYSSNNAFRSPGSNQYSNGYTHKNPFIDASVSNDLHRKLDSVIPNSSTSHTAQYLSSEPKATLYESPNAQAYKPSLDNKKPYYESPKTSATYTSVPAGQSTKPFTTSSTLGTNLSSTLPAQTSSESKPYYGDPKIKSLIDELTKGKRVDAFSQNKFSGSTTPPISTATSTTTYNPIANTSSSSTFPTTYNNYQSSSPYGTLRTSQYEPEKAVTNINEIPHRKFESFGNPNVKTQTLEPSQDKYNTYSSSSNYTPFYSSNPFNNPLVSSQTLLSSSYKPEASYYNKDESISPIRESEYMKSSPLKSNYLDKTSEAYPKSQDSPYKEESNTLESKKKLFESKEEPKQAIPTKFSSANPYAKTNTSGSFSDNPDQYQDAMSHISANEGLELLNQLEGKAKDDVKDFDVKHGQPEHLQNSADNNMNALVLSPKINDADDLDEDVDRKTSPPQKKEKTKQEKFQLILSQIDYFLHGRVSTLLEENEDDEIYCNLDDDGFIFDEDGDFVTDQNGQRVQLSPEEIERFRNENMIE